MTKIERPFLAAKGFNTNLVQCLPPQRLLFYMHNLPHVLGMHLKRFCVHDILYEKIIIFEGLL